MLFKKKPRLPRKEKKRRALMLNPRKKIEHKPYAGLTYIELEKIISDSLFGPEAEKLFKEQSQKMIIYVMVPIQPRMIKTENLTIDEIKARFPLTPEEEKALEEIKPERPAPPTLPPEDQVE